jgi:hypothetical protein
MSILAVAADERVAGVFFDEDSLSVRLKDGRTIPTYSPTHLRCSAIGPSGLDFRVRDRTGISPALESPASLS